MARKNHIEHARVTAICVNLALDGVEADIREELERVADGEARGLARVLDKLKKRRVQSDEVQSAGIC